MSKFQIDGAVMMSRPEVPNFSYVVLYKIGCFCADQPNLCGGTL
jgi:hypothetical protein